MTNNTMTKKQVTIPTFAKNHKRMPFYASNDAAGADVHANIEEEVILSPGSSTLIPTGLKVAIPAGYEIQVRPRSGLALKNQITVLNTPGTIDADYRGEIGIILINHGRENFTITPGMRIAQLIVAEFYQGNFVFVEENELNSTARGTNGFGHTGVN
jgi:dUTP pyrophosphatase